MKCISTVLYLCCVTVLYYNYGSKFSPSTVVDTGQFDHSI